jgi:hypothetical protein
MIHLTLLPADHPISAADHNRLARAIVEIQAQLSELRSAPQPQMTAAFPLEVRRRPSGWHFALAYEEQTALVELTGNLARGSSAYAKVLWRFDGDWQEAETAEITIHDALGTFEGDLGDRALVRFDRQAGQWIVWQLQC